MCVLVCPRTRAPRAACSVPRPEDVSLVRHSEHRLRVPLVSVAASLLGRLRSLPTGLSQESVPWRGGCVCEWLRACVGVCVRGCVGACVRACVRACVGACVWMRAWVGRWVGKCYLALSHGLNVLFLRTISVIVRSLKFAIFSCFYVFLTVPTLDYRPCKIFWPIKYLKLSVEDFSLNEYAV